MSGTTTKIRFFSIMQYDKEAEWLGKMHAQGWKFIGCNMPCFYHFERCERADYVYQLDYNKTGSGPDYIRMFEDCGWEYIQDCMGYAYFRKPAGSSAEQNDIFCDDESRLEMVKRIFYGRMIPLFVIFLCVICVQLPTSIIQRGMHSSITIVWLVLAALYLWLFGSFTAKYITFRRRIKK